MGPRRSGRSVADRWQPRAKASLGPGGATGAPPTLDVTFVGDRGLLDHVRNSSVGLCNPRIEKGKGGNNPDSVRLVGGQGQMIPALG